MITVKLGIKIFRPIVGKNVGTVVLYHKQHLNAQSSCEHTVGTAVCVLYCLYYKFLAIFQYSEKMFTEVHSAFLVQLCDYYDFPLS